MVPAHEHYPVVILLQALTASPVYGLVIPRVQEAETTVTGNDDEGIRHAIQDTAPIYKLLQVAMNVTADGYPSGGRKLVYVHAVGHRSVQVFRVGGYLLVEKVVRILCFAVGILPESVDLAEGLVVILHVLIHYYFITD